MDEEKSMSMVRRIVGAILLPLAAVALIRVFLIEPYKATWLPSEVAGWSFLILSVAAMIAMIRDYRKFPFNGCAVLAWAAFFVSSLILSLTPSASTPGKQDAFVIIGVLFLFLLLPAVDLFDWCIFWVYERKERVPRVQKEDRLMPKYFLTRPQARRLLELENTPITAWPKDLKDFVDAQTDLWTVLVAYVKQQRRPT